MNTKFFKQILGDAFDAGVKAMDNRKNEVRAWNDFEDWYNTYKYRLNPQYELCESGIHWFCSKYEKGNRTHNECGFCGAIEKDCKESCQYNDMGKCIKIGNCHISKILEQN